MVGVTSTTSTSSRMGEASSRIGIKGFGFGVSEFGLFDGSFATHFLGCSSGFSKTSLGFRTSGPETET